MKTTRNERRILKKINDNLELSELRKEADKQLDTVINSPEFQLFEQLIDLGYSEVESAILTEILHNTEEL